MSKNITIIPARRTVGNTITEEVKPKLRVAAYCRVSTDSEEQSTSYEAQTEHYRNFINRNDAWELVAIYADDGIPGTNTKKRDSFNKMIDECMKGKIDMIITKSISRFARNTLDCLKYIRLLKEKNIAVMFEKENINTLDSKGEVLLTIMASLAQQESESLSKNVKLGLQFIYQNGKVQVNHNRFLGYTKDEEGNLVIVPEEAEVIKRIFYEYLDGASYRRIVNNGIMPQYYVENDHEAIIPKEVYIRVQEEMLRRSTMRSGKDNKRRCYSSKYALSSRVYCSERGEIYRRVTYINRGKRVTVWECITRIDHGPEVCSGEIIKEQELHEAVMKAINKTVGNKEDILAKLKDNINDVIGDDQSAGSIDAELEKLQNELMQRAKSNKNFDDIVEQMNELKDAKKQVILDEVEQEEKNKRIEEMERFLEAQDIVFEEYDDRLVRKLVEKVVVADVQFIVTIKSGVEITVERAMKEAIRNAG